MRIGHFHYGIYRPGGICTYLKAVSQAEMRLGNDVYLFQTDNDDHPEESIAPIKVRDAKELISAATSLKLDILHLHATLFDAIPVHLPIVYTVHTNAPHCPGGTLYLARSQAPCPRSYSLTGCLVNHFTQHCGSLRPQKLIAEFRRRDMESKILPQFKIIAVSNFIKQKMADSGYDPENIDVLHNFVIPSSEQDDVAPAPDNTPPVFVNFGRLQPNKGVQWLLKSFARTTQQSKLIIAGSGTMEDELKRMTNDLDLADRVTFTGWLEHEDLERIIKTATAVIVPSLWPEPFGLVAIEAGAAAKPVIASATGGLSEIIEDNVTGCLVDSGDERGLTEAIDRLASNPGFAKQIGVQARRHIEAEFSVDKHLNRLHEIYATTISRAGRVGFNA